MDSRGAGPTDEAQAAESFGFTARVASVQVKSPVLVLGAALFVVVLGGVGLWQLSRAQPAPAADEAPPAAPAVPNPPLGPLPAEVEVDLSPMIELDFLSRAEVFTIREERVARHPELSRALVGERYVPSALVFGPMQDGKPWWGAFGITCYGQGMRSIEGPSEQSRFIANPYLLLALRELGVYTTAVDEIPDKPLLAEAASLVWSRGTPPRVTATYDLGSYLPEAKAAGRPMPNHFELVVYNARDLGFSHVWFVPVDSRNVDAWLADPAATFEEPPPSDLARRRPRRPVRLNQYIGVGNSTRYPNGANNICPYDGYYALAVGGLPALAVLKLWRNEPATVDDAPDLLYTLELRAGRFTERVRSRPGTGAGPGVGRPAPPAGGAAGP